VSNNKPILGILGAGKLGTVLAQLAVKAGYTTYIAGSGHPEKIALSIKIITPGAIASEGVEVITKADIIILALPLSKHTNLPAKLFRDKLVIDSMNYWWEVDGDMPELALHPSSSEMVQSFLADARIVKALSHMGYHNVIDDARPKSTADRRAIAIAGNNNADNIAVSQLVDDLGFDPVIIGNLNRGKLLEPGNPLFGASVSKNKMQAMLG
jgi:predicted dinucleotide-binding enzyme